MDRLKREANPPTGQLASPVPQYWNPNTEDFEYVLGAHGAPRAILYGPNGQPISSSNRLPVDAAVSGTVDVSGDPDRELGKVTLTGHLPPSAMELTVNSWDELPAPAETPKGATAQLIGTFDVRQNTGTEWVEVVL